MTSNRTTCHDIRQRHVRDSLILTTPLVIVKSWSCAKSYYVFSWTFDDLRSTPYTFNWSCSSLLQTKRKICYVQQHDWFDDDDASV